MPVLGAKIINPLIIRKFCELFCAHRGFCLQNEMTKKLAAIHKSLNICSDFYRRKIITYLARLLFVGLNVTLLNV